MPLLVFVFFLFFCGAEAAEEPLLVQGARIVDFGIYDAVRVGKEEAPKTSEGSINILHERLDPALRRQTDTVEARLGLRFGVRYEVQGKPHLGTIPIHVRITHPETKNPANGKVVTVDEWDAETSIGVTRFVGWGFDQPYEMVAGEWLLQVFHGSKLLIEQKFQVVSPPAS